MIGLVRKRALFIAAGLVVICFLVFILGRPATAPIGQGFVVAKLGEREFTLKIANTSEALKRGLSGTPKLSENEGMLFVFEDTASTCIWMKDMKFSIDILWFDANNKLIHQKQNASPESYPESFCPPESAKYVVEVSAGNAQQLDLKLGDTLKLL